MTRATKKRVTPPDQRAVVPVAPVPLRPGGQQKRFTSVRVPSVLPLHELRQGMMFGTSTIKRAAVRFRGQIGKHLLALRLTGFDVVDGARSRRRIAVR